MTYLVIPAGSMARRLIASVVVTACGATPGHVSEPGAPQLAVDDSGVVLWRIDRRGDHNSWTKGAYVEGAGVVIVTAASAAPETAFLPRPRRPMVAHLVDPHTGRERARAELAPDADAWALADIAVVGKRVVQWQHVRSPSPYG